MVATVPNRRHQASAQQDHASQAERGRLRCRRGGRRGVDGDVDAGRAASVGSIAEVCRGDRVRAGSQAGVGERSNVAAQGDFVGERDRSFAEPHYARR